MRDDPRQADPEGDPLVPVDGVEVTARTCISHETCAVDADLTAGDLAEDDAEIPAAKTWRERRNGIRPKFRSETNKWSYVSSDLVSIPAYIEEDGEEKFEEMQWDLVQRKDQVAQLAAYKLVNGREIGPLTLVCKPHMRQFGPGDMITLNLGADYALGVADRALYEAKAGGRNQLALAA